VTGPAARQIEHGLPESVATAIIEFLTGALAENPYRVGKPLRDELAGWYGARRGSFRIMYRIDETARLVEVLRIEHRKDSYRPR
jgi:mRNA-degrading endonuclease RelE of RelBE toxin-antitoxin system